MYLPACLPYTIVVADDHASFRQALKKIIEETPGLRIVGEAGDGPELYRLLERVTPDLVVLDIAMPQFRAMEATPRIKRQYPQIKVLIMIMDREREYLTNALSAGAEGVLLKQETAGEFLPAIDKIRRGGRYLPPQLLELIPRDTNAVFGY